MSTFMRRLRQTDLAYFLAVARHRSMRRAAEALHVSPSSLSRQLKKMEEVVGVQLLERRRGAHQLTTAGDLLYDHLAQMIAAEEQLRSDLEGLSGLRRGTVKIACGEGFLIDFLSSALGPISRELPGINIEILTSGTDGRIKAILEDSVDLALVLYRSPNAGIATLASCIQPLYAVMSPDHPLAIRKSVSLTDLADHSLALHLPTNGIRQLLASAEHAHGIQLTSHYSCNSTLALKTFADRLGLIAVLPYFALSPQVDKGELVAIRLDDPKMAPAEAQILMRRGRRLSVAAREVARVLATEMKAFGFHALPMLR